MTVLGVFVGGRSSRMGRPKGLLPSPVEPKSTLVEVLLSLAPEVGPAPGVLVGCQPEYGHLPFRCLPDAFDGAGPLAGFISLLRFGAEVGARRVVALACDAPYVDAPLLRRLLQEHPEVQVLCPVQQGRVQPFFSRLDVSTLSAFERAWASGERSLQPVFRALHPRGLTLREEEWERLRDWDRPEDVDSPL